MAVAPRREDEGLEVPDGLDLPRLVPEDDVVGIVDPSDEIAWTPEGANDDSSASDLPIGEPDIDDDDAGRASIDAPSLADFGETDGLVDVDAASAGDDRPLALDPSDEIDDGEGLEPDDGGAEGTSEDIGEAIDEAALPAVDADEDGVFDLGDLMRELASTGFGRELGGPPWVARDEWTTTDPFDDVAAASGRVVAVGADLVVLEPASRAVRRLRLPAHASRVAMSGPSLVIGAGATVSLVGSTAELTKTPLVLFEGQRPINALGVVAGRVWVIAGDELWVVASPPSTPKRVRASAAIDVAVAGPQLFLLTAAEGGPVLERFRGDDGDWHRLDLGHLAGRPVALAVSHRGDALAVITSEAVAVSYDAGGSFDVTALRGVLGACFGGIDGQTLLALVHSEGDVSLRAVSRAGTEEIALLHDRLASLTPEVRLAWCDAREALVVVSARGSLAIGPRPTH